jgi:hypothetical protein
VEAHQKILRGSKVIGGKLRGGICPLCVRVLTYIIVSTEICHNNSIILFINIGLGYDLSFRMTIRLYYTVGIMPIKIATDRIMPWSCVK